MSDEHDDVNELPAAAGLEFPYPHDIGGDDGRPRSAIARSLSRAQRTEVHDVWDQAHALSFGELRPCEFNVAFARAAALADQSPDPQLAALIALAAVVRCPRYIRALDHHTIAADGTPALRTLGRPLRRPTRATTLHRHSARAPRRIGPAPPCRGAPRQRARPHEPAVDPRRAGRTRRSRVPMARPARAPPSARAPTPTAACSCTP